MKNKRVELKLKKKDLVITVDIEDWYHIPSVTGSPYSHYHSTKDFFESYKGNYDYLSEPTHRVIKMLKERNLKATFFIVGEVVDNYPGLVEYISREGHEIACHGLHHEMYYYPRLKRIIRSKGLFKKNMKEAKEKLEQFSKKDVIGFRAPSAYITGWMLDILEKIGFKYDSSVSVNSLYNKTSSDLKGVSSYPYFPKYGDLGQSEVRRDFIEFPWPYLKIGKLLFPTCGGPFLRFFGFNYINQGIKQSLRRGPTCFYFHPIDISYKDFPSKFNIRRPFYWSIRGRIVEERIKQILDTYKKRINTFRELLKRIAS